jgi:hypothetical protein
MSATATKIPFSSSTDGRGIKVTTASPIDGSDTAVHTAVNNDPDYDLITIFAYNDDSASKALHLGWGGTSDPDDLIIVSIPAQSGLVLVTADLILRSGLAVVASAQTANVIVLFGHVNRFEYP